MISDGRCERCNRKTTKFQRDGDGREVCRTCFRKQIVPRCEHGVPMNDPKWGCIGCKLGLTRRAM